MSEVVIPPVHQSLKSSRRTAASGVSASGAIRWKGVRRILPVVIPLVGVLLTLPSVFMGFAQDDNFFLVLFKGKPGLTELKTGTLSTFSFGSGDVAANQVLFDRGILPWWTVPDWQVAFWRPLASLSHWVDFQLFGEHAWLMHLHSLLAYALTIAVAFQLYKRFIALSWVAALAALLFAADAAHGVPVGWLANRNAVYSAGFGLLALLLHDHARRLKTASPGAATAQCWAYATGSLGSLALSLLSGEGGIGIVGYWVAYALVLDPALPVDTRWTQIQWRQRARALRTLVPLFSVVVLWRLVYTALGYGVHGSWLYIDPISDPVVFLHNLWLYLPVLFLGLFAGIDSTFFIFLSSPWWQLQLALAMAVIPVALWLFWPHLRRDRVTWFFLLGSAAGLIPACATIPSDRLLFLCSFGMSGLLAGLGVALFDRVAALSRPRRLSIYTVLALNGLLSPILLLGNSYSIAAMEHFFHSANDSVPVAQSDSDQTFVVVHTPLDLLGMSMPYTRSAQEQPVPKHWWSLSAGLDAVDVYRDDAHRIRLRAEAGFLRQPWAQIFRQTDAYPMYVGQTVTLPGMTAAVLDVMDDGRPREVAFTFERQLDDPTLTWLTWRDGRYAPFTLPEAGAMVELPAIAPLSVLRTAMNQNG